MLRSAGLQDEEIQELSDAIAADEATPKADEAPSMGERVKAWLGSLQIKAAQGLASVSTDVVAGLITAALLAYFGVNA